MAGRSKDFKDKEKRRKYLNINRKLNYDRGRIDCYPHKWTPEEDDLVLHSNLIDREISKLINHSVQAIQLRRSRLKKKLKGGMKMKVCLEGSDGAGKSTLVKHLQDNYNLKMIHSSNLTENTLQYHLDLIKEDNVVLDRANLGEIVYPTIYNREPKMTWSDQTYFMNKCLLENVIYIIFYASDFNTLKDRLFKRGDTQQVLDNAEKINLAFKMLAEMFSSQYSNVYALDISKVNDQIKFFEDIIR